MNAMVVLWVGVSLVLAAGAFMGAWWLARKRGWTLRLPWPRRDKPKVEPAAAAPAKPDERTVFISTAEFEAGAAALPEVASEGEATEFFPMDQLPFRLRDGE